jgi:carbon monoxide dehydrogenase subunit G
MRGVPAAVLTIALLLARTLALSASDVSGTWNLEMKFPTATSTGTCVFKQDGETLNGTCGGSERFAITGEINGSRLSWQFYVKQGGSEGRMEFTGELDGRGTTITGSCRVVEGPDGTFTMKKQA